MGFENISPKEMELYLEMETFLKQLFAGYYILNCLSFQLHVIHGSE